MKKLLAVLLAVVMLFSVCAFSTSAETTTTAKVTIVTNEGSAVAADTPTYFTVKFTNFSEIKGVDVYITADQNIKLEDINVTGFPSADKDNNYTQETSEDGVTTVHFVDLTKGEDGKITFKATVPADATTTADPTIKVTGQYAKDGTNLFEVAAPADGTFELIKEIAVSEEQQTDAESKVNVTVANGTFVPQGSVFVKNDDGTYTFAKKEADGTFTAADAGKYVYQSFAIPENGLTTFGVSQYLEDNNRIRFGNYSTLNAEGTEHGTLVFEGEWLELKNYYIQKGYTVQQFIELIYKDVTTKLAANENAKFVYYKVNGETINVYRFVQKNHMWKNGNVLEYAIRLNGALTDTVYTAVAFSVAGEKVTLSKNIKSVTHK